MNEAMIKQIQDDYREILSNEAGKRIFGGIFFAAGLTGTQELNAFYQGRRSVGIQIANTIRMLDPRLVGECEMAYVEMRRNYEDERDNGDDTGNYDY